MSDEEETEKGPIIDTNETIGDYLRDEVLASKTWTTLVMTATFFALFQQDVCQMFAAKNKDAPLAYITLGWFCIFLFEIILNFVLKIDYGAEPGAKKFTFYLFLDLIGTLSLIPDFIIIFGVEVPASKSMILARVARTARIGARLTRLMKLFRSKGGSSAYSSMMANDESEAMSESAASKFGETVSDGISKKVVFLTLTLLIMVPLFEPAVEPAKQDLLNMLNGMDMRDLTELFGKSRGALAYFQTYEEAQLVKLEIRDDIKFTVPNEDPPRGKLGNCNAYKPIISSGLTARMETWNNAGTLLDDLSHPFLTFKNKNNIEFTNYRKCPHDRNSGGLQASYACLVSCTTLPDPIVDWENDKVMRAKEVLTYPCTDEEISEGDCEGAGKEAIDNGAKIWATFYIRNLVNYDAYLTIIYMLFNIAVFGAATGVFLNEVFDLIVNPMERICLAVASMAATMAALQGSHEDDDEGDEFTKLSGSIVKMTDLLKTSLGSAGAAIIKNNLDGESTSIDPMIPGKKVQAYYCFCDVRGFATVMDKLQEDIMVFTNVISDHVHRKCAEHMGNPNKNIGDSWLCVWSGREEASMLNQGDGSDLTYADHAVMACVEIKESTKDDADLIDFAKTVGSELSMGFGLHYGWSIEGAVGSDKKVDATYLSPHVNMSARLEAATKQFDCSILVSEDFYKRMSAPVQRNMRKVDRVLVVGSTWPMILYAYDEGADEGNGDVEKKNRFTYEFDQAVDKYISGQWADAKKLLYSCLGARPSDVASTNLLDFMAQYGNGDNAPADWQGYRALEGK